jgi:hypothetical protein
MWSIIISPSSKKKVDQFKPFTIKYKTKAEAEAARWKLINIARSTGVLAPCDAETGHEETVFLPKPWSVGQITEC